ncbi:hypothetical protein BU23DRAFT_602354 [Bimuria novae-zelandiae CBS 107.79]|uniref:Uncharacterized protein n=1 Tax=Bimuria novae-zelandiae CBS 107.79 TaxID=1447943 RepID=A0A6A5USN2_9PLEO|nr:hypothetical protein BU23DRAFT_602354 [Bimuria novae-zelandiae CBS 107.79]
MLVLQLSMPTRFLRHLRPSSKLPFYSLTTFRRLDLIGCFLLFGSCALLAACVQEGGLRYRWSAALVIVLLTLCAVLWLAFAVWEWFITKRQEGALGPEACEKIFHDSLQDAILPAEIADAQSAKTIMEPVSMEVCAQQGLLSHAIVRLRSRNSIYGVYHLNTVTLADCQLALCIRC